MSVFRSSCCYRLEPCLFDIQSSSVCMCQMWLLSECSVPLATLVTWWKRELFEPAVNFVSSLVTFTTVAILIVILSGLGEVQLDSVHIPAYESPGRQGKDCAVKPGWAGDVMTPSALWEDHILRYLTIPPKGLIGISRRHRPHAELTAMPQGSQLRRRSSCP